MRSDPGADGIRWRACSGRVPAGAFTVAVRRPDGTPAVIENAPLLDDGTPHAHACTGSSTLPCVRP